MRRTQLKDKEHDRIRIQQLRKVKINIKRNMWTTCEQHVDNKLNNDADIK